MTLALRTHHADPPVSYLVVGCLLAIAAGSATALVQPLLVVGVAGALLACLVAAIAAYRPIFATYAYLGTVLLIAGIDRGTLAPLVRPNEALLALLVAGALLGGYLRYLRGERYEWVPSPLDVPLAVLLVLSTVWPVAWFMIRGHQPSADDVSAVLPMVKLAGLYILVRVTVTTQSQRLNCVRLIVWPGAVIAVLAVLQILDFGPLVSALERGWGSDTGGGSLGERGTTTLSSSIATGDVVMMSLLLVLWCGLRGLLGRRERWFLGVVLACGVLAAGQFSTWIAAAIAAVLCLWRYPQLRGPAVRLWPVAVIALVVGGPALIGRLAGFGDYGVPRSWLGRWDNLSSFYLPRLGDFNWVLGVQPDSVLPAPETFRDVIYLESGYLQLLWIGGVPLLVAFCWFSVVALRELRRRADEPGMVGASASALEVVWWILLVLMLIDPHFTVRGTGDLVFVLLALTTAAGHEPRARRVTPRATPQAVAVRGSAASRVVDVVLSGSALLLLALPMLFIAAMIRMSSPGPALFRQQRAGQYCQPFTMYKFRTMRGGDDGPLRDLIERELRGEDTSVDGSCKIESDPRITTVGRFLRRTSLDELPQLINVLRGEMAVVGPRPCLGWEADMFPARYAERFSVKPGLTGLWQVSGRSTLGTLDMLELDTEYARTRRFRGDLAIMLRTAPVLVRGDGAR